jgi:hypothetical protein
MSALAVPRLYRHAILVYLVAIVAPVAALVWLGIQTFERQRTNHRRAGARSRGPGTCGAPGVGRQARLQRSHWRSEWDRPASKSERPASKFVALGRNGIARPRNAVARSRIDATEPVCRSTHPRLRATSRETRGHSPDRHQPGLRRRHSSAEDSNSPAKFTDRVRVAASESPNATRPDSCRGNRGVPRGTRLRDRRARRGVLF